MDFSRYSRSAKKSRVEPITTEPRRNRGDVPFPRASGRAKSLVGIVKFDSGVGLSILDNLQLTNNFVHLFRYLSEKAVTATRHDRELSPGYTVAKLVRIVVVGIRNRFVLTAN